jgi:DNA-binding protein WhiA
VKNEASKLETLEPEKISELSAIIVNIAGIDKKIQLTTENASVARRIFNLIKDLYGLNCKLTVRHGYNFNRNYLYLLEINYKVSKILNDLSVYEEEHKLDFPKDYILADEELKRAYLRGLFLAIGSINDPKKSRYHLEFLIDNEKYAIFIQKLLNDFNLNSKIIKRDYKFMVYIKEAEKIGDFLRIIDASQAVLYYEDIRIYRDHKNMTNRLNNCEQANVDKIVATANEQVKDIEIIESVGGFDLLDDKVKEVCIYRKKYSDASLEELSNIIGIETGNLITKSGIYHRLCKVKKLANKIRETGRK